MRDGVNDERSGDHHHRTARPRSSWTLWIVLGAVGCVTVIGCLGLLAMAGYFGYRAFATDMPAARDVADQFLDLLQENKIDEAYHLTSPGFRRRQDAAQFARFIQDFESFTRHTSRTQNGIRLFQDGSGKRVFIQMTLNAPKNAMTCTVVLIEDGGDWLVDQITMP
jgi:hypothetical protein